MKDFPFVIPMIIIIAVTAYFGYLAFQHISNVPITYDQSNDTQRYSKPCMGGTTSSILYCLNQHVALLENKTK